MEHVTQIVKHYYSSSSIHDQMNAESVRIRNIKKSYRPQTFEKHFKLDETTTGPS